MNNIFEEITRTSISILLKEPFYAHIFSCINKQLVPPDDRIKTLAIGLYENQHILFVNEHFWTNVLTTPNLRYGVLKHEILHIILKHTVTSIQGEDRLLVNIAMDLVVNQYIDRLNLPEGAILFESFPEIQFQPDQSWQYYYKLLLELDRDEDGTYKNSVAKKNLESIKQSDELNKHVLWEDFQKLSDGEKKILGSGIDYLIRRAWSKTNQSGRSAIPRFIKRLIDQILLPNKKNIPWRKMIKLFAQSSSKTYIKSTLKKRSKRYGTIPGIKVKSKPHFIVGVDTSASISKIELSTFFSEIHKLYKMGLEIEVVEADQKICRAYEYKGRTPQFAVGEQGTDFDLLIQYANNKNTDGIIYFTDGLAYPPKRKSKFPLLWVITSFEEANTFFPIHKLPGRKVELTN